MDGKGWTTETDGETESYLFVFILINSVVREFRMIGKARLGLTLLLPFVPSGDCTHVFEVFVLNKHCSEKQISNLKQVAILLVFRMEQGLPNTCRMDF